ncbi:ricin-type beta-trefoil lectin domain protein [Myxococcota bacterium]
MLRNKRIAAVFSTVMIAAACGTADDTSVSSDIEEVDVVTNAMANAFPTPTNPFRVVAVYTHLTQGDNAGKFGHCSGRVLDPYSPTMTILTARHCITVSGEEGSTGPLAAASDIYVTGHPSPGYELPSFAVATDSRTAPEASSPVDLAILRMPVFSDLEFPNTELQMVGLSLVPTDQLLNDQHPSVYIRHTGYGVSVDGVGDTFGILRFGMGFRVTNERDLVVEGYRQYTYRNTGSSGEKVLGGDSGGPAFYWPPGAPYNQVGVHKAMSTDQNRTWGYDFSIYGNWPWIQAQLGYVYLRSAAYPENRVFHEDTTSKTLLKTRPNVMGHSWKDKLVYDKASKTIRVWNSSGPTNKCVDLRWNDSSPGEPFWLWTCSGGNAQRFVMTSNYQLALEGHSNRCLKETSDNRLVVAACSTEAGQIWTWDYDPGKPQLL